MTPPKNGITTKIAKLGTDVYGDHERGIKGLRKEVDDLNEFRENFDDFKIEVKAFFKGVTWAIRGVFAVLALLVGLIGWVLATFQAQVVVTDTGNIERPAVVLDNPNLPIIELPDINPFSVVENLLGGLK